MNLIERVYQTARLYPNKTAVIAQDRSLCFHQLFTQAMGVAHGLKRMGVEPGDRVAIMLPNAADFPVCYYGVLSAGAIAVMISPWYKENEVHYILADSGAQAVVVAAGLEALAQTVRSRGLAHLDIVSTGDAPLAGCHLLHEWIKQPSDGPVWSGRADAPATLLYTGAFDGKPRGAVLTHSNLATMAELIKRYYCLSPQDNVLCTIPLFHIFGLTCAMNIMAVSGATTYLQDFDAPKILELLETCINAFIGVPTMFLALAMTRDSSKPHDLRHLRICVSGGAPLSEDIYNCFYETFGVPIRQGYGLTEASPVVTLHPLDGRVVPNSCGLPLDGITTAIVDARGHTLEPGQVGEVVVRGPTVMQGYWRQPDETEQAFRGGWLHTGDLAYRDEYNYYYLVGRQRNFIIRGGLNVYPREVEILLENHPAVARARVLGVPDPFWGENVKALVQLKPDCQATPTDLLTFCKSRISSYKRPRQIEMVSQIPEAV